MKTVLKNKKISWLLITLGVLILVVGFYTAFAYTNKSWPFPRPIQSSPTTTRANLTPPTKAQTDNGNAIKDASLKEESQPAPTGEVALSITSANQNNNILQIRTLIQAVTNSGTCTLTLTKTSSVITKTASVQAQSSTSTCVGFDIPTGELSPGTWQLNISFKNNTINGSISKTIDIQ